MEMIVNDRLDLPMGKTADIKEVVLIEEFEAQAGEGFVDPSGGGQNHQSQAGGKQSQEATGELGGDFRAERVDVANDPVIIFGTVDPG